MTYLNEVESKVLAELRESEGRIPWPCSGDSGEDIAKDIAKQDRENEDYDYTLGGKV